MLDVVRLTDNMAWVVDVTGDVVNMRWLATDNRRMHWNLDAWVADNGCVSYNRVDICGWNWSCQRH